MTTPKISSSTDHDATLTLGETSPHLVNADNQGKPLIVVHDLHKTYQMGQTHVHALRGISLEVSPGEFVAVRGPSGSGKSTFMNIIGCLDRPTQGAYWLAGRQVSHMSTQELARIRNRMIGFVFQGFNLLSRDSALSNVELPMIYAGLTKRLRVYRARQALRLVGLGSHMEHKPASFQEDSNNASPLPVPWSIHLHSCSPMSRQVTWIRTRVSRLWASCRPSISRD